MGVDSFLFRAEVTLGELILFKSNKGGMDKEERRYRGPHQC
jgi:hypothetical protein